MLGCSFTTTCNLVLTAGMLFATGCNYQIQKKSLTGVTVKTPVGVEVISSTVIQTEVLSSCTHCHGAGQRRPELVSISEIRTQSSAILDAVMSGDMPKPNKGDAPLTSCQKAVLSKWVAMGLPESSSVVVSTLPDCKGDANGANTPPGPAASPSPSPAPASQSPVPNLALGDRLIEGPVLGVCLHCHAAGDEDPDLSSIDLIKAGLHDVLTAIDSGKMPSKRKGDKPLTACQKAILHKWVELNEPSTSTVMTSSLPECQ